MSYSTSPAFEVPKGGTESATVALLDTCFRQVEYAGVIKGATNETGARSSSTSLLSKPVQKDIPGSMYMYPVLDTATLPADWVTFAPLSKASIAVPPPRSRPSGTNGSRTGPPRSSGDRPRGRSVAERPRVWPSGLGRGGGGAAGVPRGVLRMARGDAGGAGVRRRRAVRRGTIRRVLAGPTWRIVSTTLTLAALGTVASVLLGVPGAYVLYVCRFPGRALIRALVGVLFVLPTVVVGAAFLALLGPTGPLVPGLGQSRTAIVLALVFFNYSIVVRTVGGMVPLDPRMPQAAPRMGASPCALPHRHPASPRARARVRGIAGVPLLRERVRDRHGPRWVRYGTIETEIWYQTTQLLDLAPPPRLSIIATRRCHPLPARDECDREPGAGIAVCAVMRPPSNRGYGDALPVSTATVVPGLLGRRWSAWSSGRCATAETESAPAR